MADKKTGILLLSHGSRLDDGEEVIKAYKEMYVEEFPDMPVEYGFMEIRKPGIPETIKKLTSENDLEKIIVVPVFVAHGLHTKRDIPGFIPKICTDFYTQRKAYKKEMMIAIDEKYHLKDIYEKRFGQLPDDD